ncbi:hypothetical protein QKW52_22660 [Bacillus sonorensis]|nr:hypothetical protein [Bacillus sonorensis]
MAKVYKAEFYITDVNCKLQDIEDIKQGIEEAPAFRWTIVHVADVKESNEFEWDDDLKINHIEATTDDYEEYLKGR